ncbi:hypothetical protein BVX97_01140 [bacterium E08(2017)]|nr:hypothetical protein BVX97_01140 [bacterium E08(2017)]
MKKLSDLGENEAIKRLTDYLTGDETVIVGPGDDCAVVRASPNCKVDILMTSDPVIEDVHFTKKSPPEGIGHKAIGRALSDIASMGGSPTWALINTTAPESTDITHLQTIFKSAAALAMNHGCHIVGGDLANNTHIEMHVFCAGTVPAGEAILRSGAKSGDIIYVTGSLGGSRKWKQYIFTPRLKEGLFLRGWASSMIDISDGLGTDIRNITTASGVGARLRTADIPLSQDADSLKSAFTDGEDFELLFTIPPDKKDEFIKKWQAEMETPVSEIGFITDEPQEIDLVLPDGKIRMMDEEGFQHF